MDNPKLALIGDAIVEVQLALLFCMLDVYLLYSVDSTRGRVWLWPDSEDCFCF